MEEPLCFSTILKSTDTAPQEIIDDIKKQVPELLEKANIKLNYVRIVPDRRNWNGGASTGFFEITETSTKEKLLYKTKIFPVVHEYKILDYSLQLKEAKSHWDKKEREKCKDLQESIDFHKIVKNQLWYCYAGDGIRNPVIDHEFCHCLIFDREFKDIKWTTFLGNHAKKCEEFCNKTKISSYCLVGGAWEAMCEVYAFWKAGNKIPMELEYGFRRIEDGNLEFCSKDHAKDIYF
jgi:hypothetical protein